MKYLFRSVFLLAIAAATPDAAPGLKKKPAPRPALDDYLAKAGERARIPVERSPGSLFTSGSRFGNLGQDLRARDVFDLVTISVSESLSAAATGTTKTSRSSSANSSVNAVLGAIPATRALPNLTKLSTATQLNGEGTTSRVTTLTASISAHVMQVLPNGSLVVEGQKIVQVNSEDEVITVRGIVRPVDIAFDNSIQSDRVAEMEIRVNGKGVVNDAARRPAFLYRLLLGLLPF